MSSLRSGLFAGVTVALLTGCTGLQARLALPDAAQSGSGAAFLPSTSSANYSVVYEFKGRTDGFSGINDLVDIDGTLYGATASGGNRGCYIQGCGTFYSLTTSGHKTLLYRFGGAHGIGPSGELIHRGKQIYGVTMSGGAVNRFCPKGCGTVFEINTSGVERVLHSFTGTDGEEPIGGLLMSGGKLYGTTSAGGRYLYGTVFVTELGGRTSVLHQFRGNKDGSLPGGSLIAVNGTFYGTTNQGGSADGCSGSVGAGGCGTVFEFDPVSRRESIIYKFEGGADGSQPVSGLVEVHGVLYGTTALGGTGTCSVFYSACGTVFAITTSGQHSVLHSFYGYPGDGNRPWAGRLLGVNGTLYGATPFGGTESKYYCTFPNHPGCGVVFSVRP